MIGKTKTVVVNDFLKKSANTLEKVDIDFFSEGLQTKYDWQYTFTPLSPQRSIRIIEEVNDGLGLEIINDMTLLQVTLNNLNVGFSNLTETKNYCFINDLEDGNHTITAYFSDDSIQKLTINSKRSMVETGSYMDIPKVNYHKALDNVVKLWLLSRKYDRIRKPNWAGFFDNLLREYPMNEEGSNRIINDLTNNIQDKIPGVVITDVKAIPNLQDKSWSVSVKSVDTDTNISTQFMDTDNIKVTSEELKVLSK